MALRAPAPGGGIDRLLDWRARPPGDVVNEPEIAAAVLAGNALLALACAGLAHTLARWTSLLEIKQHLRRMSIAFLGLTGAFALGAAATWWRT